MKKKGRIGSSFDDFLKQEGIYEKVTARAAARISGKFTGSSAFADDDTGESDNRSPAQNGAGTQNR